MAQAAQRAYAHLRARLLAGEFPAGARLPEEELAAAARVSRTPVREALRRLHAEGLVEFVPNRGAHVANWTARDLDEIFGLRALLESHAAELAAPRIGAADLSRLSALQDRMDAAGRRGGTQELDQVAELNNAFHEIIHTAADNRRLVTLLGAVVQTPLVHRTFRRYTPEALERSFAHHRELVAALRARDPAWAGSVMRSHVLAARATLLGARDERAREDTA
jgi:DNA-binding GntR family transcriptional regulator